MYKVKKKCFFFLHVLKAGKVVANYEGKKIANPTHKKNKPKEKTKNKHCNGKRSTLPSANEETMRNKYIKCK